MTPRKASTNDDPPTIVQFPTSNSSLLCSDKARIPAWCDRILWRGDGLRQTQYHTADLRCSDHRPVFAKFDCKIDVVDLNRKDSLRRELYKERQREALPDPADLLDFDEEDNYTQGPIAPGLPPASSDRNRWWLDNSTSMTLTLDGFLALDRVEESDDSCSFFLVSFD